MRDRHLLLVAPREQLPAFSELLQAWREAGMAVTVSRYVGAPPDVVRMAGRIHDIDAVMVAGSSRYAPSTVLPGPFVHRRDGSRLPAAWMPIKNEEGARRFAAAAARVQRRSRHRVAVALLAQWHPRYLRLADRLQTLLHQRVDTLRWTADVIRREDMVDALGSGLGLGVYMGHGRPMGWVGYHGVRRHHFGQDQVDASPQEPLGSLVSLCCRTASRRRVGLSYAEAMAMMGAAAASFGAIGDTLHTDNTRWAIGLCDALAAGAQTIGELITRGAPAAASACASYRLIGDPTAPLATDQFAIDRAGAVRTHA